MSILEQLFTILGSWIIIGLTAYYTSYIYFIKQYKKNKRLNETFDNYMSKEDRHDTLILFSICPIAIPCYGVVMLFEYINKRIRNYFNV